MARNIITGIDVGSYYVKVVIATTKERTERGMPKIIGAAMTESRGLRHGYVTNLRDVSDAIKRAVASAEEKAGIKVKKAFVGVGGIGLGSITVTSSVVTSRADALITKLDLEKLREQCEKDIPRSGIANRRIIYLRRPRY